MMAANDEQLRDGSVPQLRAYWGDEHDEPVYRHLSEPMRRARRAWARVEAYRANLNPSGRLAALIVG